MYARDVVDRKSKGLRKYNFPNQRAASHNAILSVLAKRAIRELNESMFTRSKDEMSDYLLESSFDQSGNEYCDLKKARKRLEAERKKIQRAVKILN